MKPNHQKTCGNIPSILFSQYVELPPNLLQGRFCLLLSFSFVISEYGIMNLIIGSINQFNQFVSWHVHCPLNPTLVKKAHLNENASEVHFKTLYIGVFGLQSLDYSTIETPNSTVCFASHASVYEMRNRRSQHYCNSHAKSIPFI